jgi:inner membrane protein
MDNLTHSLVGLAVAKSGLEKFSPATTLVCIVAANAPDVDLVSGLFGDRWTALHYHRGITHSIVGTITLGFLVPTLFYLADRLSGLARARPATLRWRGLLLASMIAVATHPLMDLTNNYGVRPLLPWSGRWFYGDLVYVIDPFLWLLLGLAAFLLTADSRARKIAWALLVAVATALIVFAGTARQGIAHPRVVLAVWIVCVITGIVAVQSGFISRPHASIARLALALVVLYWGGLTLLHWQALQLARAQTANLTQPAGETVRDLAVMPTMANPSRWTCVAKTDQAFYRFDVSLWHREAGPVARFPRSTEPSLSPATLAAQDRRAAALLEFSRFPAIRSDNTNCATQMLVQIADLRYTEPGGRRGNFSLEIPVECPPH